MGGSDGLGKPLEVDEDTSDYGSSLQSDVSESITSSIVNYVYENGRRYHRLSEGKYTLPNDETEQNRLDLLHHLYLLLLNGELCRAPITSSCQRILDCGTGTGIWALDMGDTHPHSEIIGVDLSPIQPGWVAANVKFYVDDIEKDWTFPKNYFDFIHSRDLANSVRDWPKYLESMYRHMKSGGYVELAEHSQALYCDDDTYPPSTPLHVFLDEYFKASIAAGLKLPDDVQLKAWLEEAGFCNIEIHKYRVPWGVWQKDKTFRRIAQIMLRNVEDGIEAYSLQALTRFGGFSPEDAKKLCKAALDDVKSRKVHAYQLHWHIVARKPEDEDER